MGVRGLSMTLIGVWVLGLGVPASSWAVNPPPSSSEAISSEPDFEWGRPQTDRAWFAEGPSLVQRARQARRQGLQRGQSNLEGPARALIALSDAAGALRHAQLAVELAPDLPIAHATLARAHWESGAYRSGVLSLWNSVEAIPRYLEARLWLSASLLGLAVIVLLAAPIVLIFMVGCLGFSSAAHDLGDLFSERTPGFARAALLLALIGLPLTFGEGLAGLLLGALAIGAIYGGPRHRAVLSLAVLLLGLGMFPISRIAGVRLGALDADPVASASLAIVRDMETSAQVAVLQEAQRSGDPLASRMLAVRALRQGDLSAREHFEGILANSAPDPYVLTTLGNMAFRAGNNREAIDFYDRARALEESPLILFDLAQAYAREFRMAEFEQTLARAQRLDPQFVEELSSFGDANFVAEASLSTEPIRERMFERSEGDLLTRTVRGWLAPGWLGDSPIHLLGGFLIVLCAGTLVSRRFQGAGQCARCGRRICSRCDRDMGFSQVCDDCIQLFSRPQGTDPELRMRRLSRLRQREQRFARVRLITGWTLPGVSGLLAQRPDIALVSILFFVATFASLIFSSGVVPDPLAIGRTGTLILMFFAGLMAFGYVTTTWFGVSQRRSL